MTTMKEYKAHRKALKKQIEETRALLERLEAELEEDRHEMQHEEVDHLEEYIEKAQPHIGDFRTLTQTAMEDLGKSVHRLVDVIRGQKKD
ncbi:hypothetical protein GCM10023116_30120 [Kistimonas scapharcae]|uniref:Uncharacterized protein n=1 Tax=Kistimonas scapharcae TaxID=1036133 RepID=A0ABP8V5N6_9GAMM